MTGHPVNLVTGPAVTVPTLVVAEVFGPTIQGEGPSAGRRAGFVRLMGCNLHCSWCDEARTWDATRFDLHAEGHRRTVPDILTGALRGAPELVVITGGEPLLHQEQPGWIPLITGLSRAGVQIEIETNGTVPPAGFTASRVTRLNVSPKLAHAGDTETDRLRYPVLRALNGTGKAVFKFVCQNPEDLAEVSAVAARAGIPATRIWVMPEGTTPEAVLAGFGDLADMAIARGFNVTTRLHVLAWPGEDRGR